MVVKGSDGERLLNTPFASLNVMPQNTPQEVTLTKADTTRYGQLQAYPQSRPALELTVIGHTDCTSRAAINDASSLKLTEAVRELIRLAGINVLYVSGIGRGAKHNPDQVVFRTSTVTLGVRGTEFIINTNAEWGLMSNDLAKPMSHKKIPGKAP